MTNTGKTFLSDHQKQKMKKYAVYAAMGIFCVGIILFIYSPSADDKANREQSAGFNTDIPLPKETGLFADKRNAYEQEQVKQHREERMRTLQDFSSLLNDNSPKNNDELSIITDEPTVTKPGINDN